MSNACPIVSTAIIVATLQSVHQSEQLLPLLISKSENLAAESENCFAAAGSHSDYFLDFIKKLKNYLKTWRFEFPSNYMPRAYTCRIHSLCHILQPHYSTYNNLDVYHAAYSMINISQAVFNVIFLLFILISNNYLMKIIYHLLHKI